MTGFLDRYLLLKLWFRLGGEIFFVLSVVGIFFSCVTLKATTLPTISVIIDDVGDSRILGYRAANLPKQVALSILPRTPYSQKIATFGHQRGMDILLHQPMESFTNVKLLGPGALFKNMSRTDFNQTLETNLKAIPYVVGVNNHMGSLLTMDQEKMDWLMAELKAKEMFFVDSRTTAGSVAARTAKNWDLPTMSRMVFLDHIDQPQAIAKQFQRLLKFAKKYGHAIAIAHPRKNTLSFLEENLHGIENIGFRLVSLSQVIQNKFYPLSLNQSWDLLPVLVADNCVQHERLKRSSIQFLRAFASKALCTH